MSVESSDLYFGQSLLAPRNGTRLEENAKGRARTSRDLWISTISLLSLIIALLTTACGPRGARLQSSDETSPAETPLVVLSGGESTAPRHEAKELEGANLTIAEPVAESKLKNLQAFAKDPGVSERVRLVLGWLEFFRNQSVLPGISAAWSKVQAGDELLAIAQNEPIPEEEIERAKVSQMEFRLWRELLRSSAGNLDGTDEISSDALSRLDRLALMIAAAERAEDLQDLDRWLPTKGSRVSDTPHGVDQSGIE